MATKAETEAAAAAKLDVLDLGDIEVKTRGGRLEHPYKGMKAWAQPYGLAADEQRIWVERFTTDNRDKAFAAMCEFVVQEVPKIDARSPRTGEQLTADNPAAWPDDLLGWIGRRLLGIETEGEG